METRHHTAFNFVNKRFSLQYFTLVFWGVGILFLASQLSIPLEPVPITLQTVGVMLLGLLFDRRTAILSVLIYLGLGGIGVPVFANFHGGSAHLCTKSAGYLWGFLAAVIIMTTLQSKLKLQNQNIFHIASNCLVGTVVILISGIGWLSQFLGFEAAIRFGLIPFIIPGIIKIMIATAAVWYIKRRSQ